MDVLQAIRERRSINFFDTDKGVSDGKLKELIEVAKRAFRRDAGEFMKFEAYEEIAEV